MSRTATKSNTDEMDLEEAKRRADKAERELAALRETIHAAEAGKAEPKANSGSEEASAATPRRSKADSAGAADTTRGNTDRGSASHARRTESDAAGETPEELSGVEALRQDSMMAHLLDSLDAGKDIGHYGRLVFAMVARHYLPDEELIARLTKDRDFNEEAATALLRQVEGRDYNPPRRGRIVQWQKEQEFPIMPNADDPDCGNVYRNLKFPSSVYEHIEEYQEEKAEASGQE